MHLRSHVYAIPAVVALALAATPAHATDASLNMAKVYSYVNSAHVTCAAAPYSDAEFSGAAYEVTLSGLSTARLAGLSSALLSTSGSYGVFLEWIHYVDVLNNAWGEVESDVKLYLNDDLIGEDYRADGPGTGTVEFRPGATLVSSPPSLVNGDVIRVEVITAGFAECWGFTSFDQATAKGAPTWAGADIFYSY